MSTQQEDEVPDMIRQHRRCNIGAPPRRQETAHPLVQIPNAESNTDEEPANTDDQPTTPPPRPYTRSRAISDRESANILNNAELAIARAERAMGKFKNQ